MTAVERGAAQGTTRYWLRKRKHCPSTERQPRRKRARKSDPPPADGVDIIVNHSEEHGGPVTEGMQTSGRLASPWPSPVPPARGSSFRKRRAETKRMGVSKRARQLDMQKIQSSWNIITC